VENGKLQEVDPDLMYGIAKKFNHEMMAFPMHTHSAIVEMVRCGMQHRNLAMAKADKDADDELRKRAVDIREQELQLMRRAQEQGYQPPGPARDPATGGIAIGPAVVDPNGLKGVN
jgi:hypothetical protein